MAAAARGSPLGTGEEPPTVRPWAGVGEYAAEAGFVVVCDTGFGTSTAGLARLRPGPEKLSDLGRPKQLPMVEALRTGDIGSKD